MSQIVPLRRNQRRALAALLTCKTISEAASTCHLSEKTFYRYLADPVFRLAVTQAETENIDATGRRLMAGQQAALDTLEAIMTEAKKDSDRRLAAIAWVDLTLRFRELRNVEQRLAALEAAFYGKH